MLEAKIFLDEGDIYESKPMHEYLMRYLMHHGISGASVFEAYEGYGKKHHLHHLRGIGTVDESPLMILFIDDEEKVKAVLPHLKEVVSDGLIFLSKVEKY
jgi:PII-like signaling protein